MTATDVWSQVEVNPTDLRPDDFSETLIEPPSLPSVGRITSGDRPMRSLQLIRCVLLQGSGPLRPSC